MSFRRLDDHLLTYHAGSGDTHLLTPLGQALLTGLGAEASRSLAEIRTHPDVAGLGASDHELADTLWMLEEAGIILAVAVDT